jgi:hypothetical protein
MDKKGFGAVEVEAPVMDMSLPVLCDYDTGTQLRNATAEELAASIAAAERDSGAGVIEVDGRDCYVQD